MKCQKTLRNFTNTSKGFAVIAFAIGINIETPDTGHNNQFQLFSYQWVFYT